MWNIRATAPGAWLVVTAPGVALLVESRPNAAWDARELLAAVRASEPIPATLDVLTAGGFSAVPAFGLVRLGATGAHYVIRGAVELELDGPEGRQTASGAGIASWTEQLAADVTGFTLHVAGATGGEAVLPLVEGAAWADSVASTPSDAEAEAAAPASAAPAARPAPSPAPQPSPTPATTPTPAPAREEPAESPAPADRVSQETLLPPALESTSLAEHPLPPTPLEPTTDDTTGYDHLFGATIMKSVESAAIRPATDEDEEPAGAPSAAAAPATGAAGAGASADAPVTAPSTAVAGDHDGLTLMSGDIAELRKRAGGRTATETGTEAGAEDGASRHDDSRFRLELSDGTSETLDRPVIVGRAPSANKVSGAELPRLLTVGKSDPDISRNHVRFTVEGGTVVITDLHSRNGTIMSLPGRPPQKLREGEPTSALAGTVVDLGGGIRITVTEEQTAAED